MSKRRYRFRGQSPKNKRLIVMAYSYFWTNGLLMIAFFVIVKYHLRLACIPYFAVSIWGFVGYAAEWKHIYWAIMNWKHRLIKVKQKPNWNNIPSLEALWMPLLNAAFGVLMLIV